MQGLMKPSGTYKEGKKESFNRTSFGIDEKQKRN